MAGFPALTGLVSGTELCSNREQTNQKPVQVFMCTCQPAFSRIGQGDLVLRRCVWWLESSFSKPINHGWRWSLSHSSSQLCCPGCAWPAAPNPWTFLLESRRTVHSNKVAHLGLSQHWFFKSKWRGKMSPKATAPLFSPWLNLRAKYNSLPISRSVISFAIYFPLQCWANGRRAPAAEEKKKKSLLISNSWSLSPCIQTKFLNGKYILVIAMTWT